MEGEFRPIDGYAGYRVSRDGGVESCWTRRGRYCIPTETWRPLKPILRGGYPTVNLAWVGKKTACKIHRLVLAVFVGPCPEGMVRCHNDGDRSNNSLFNVRWVTHHSNSDDSLRHGTRARGPRCGATKLSEDEVVQIRLLRADGETIGDLAVRFGVTRGNIKAIVYRRSWRHLPCPKGAVASTPPVC
jgi:hypothetical protein